MRVFAGIDEVKAALGEELGPSEPLEIDQDRIGAFAGATGDHQWIHVDPERAANGPFGTTIAHGFLTLSLLPWFGQRLFRLDFGTTRINYGLNKVRFPVPVPVGSRLTATATFTDVREGPAGATLTVRYAVTADGAPKPACVAEMLLLVA
ncbi:MaoC family dehydratase [Amycolatopsis thermoflava]|uniref:MaoC family dehydratase n=1 Tax=Amycolatopsis thermoflava TaxID=84480 RepID=UPI003F4A4425